MRARLQLRRSPPAASGACSPPPARRSGSGSTTAIAGAALAHLGYLQVDNTIVAYNQAAAQLDALQRDARARGARTLDLERRRRAARRC